MRTTDWLVHAACREVPNETFFDDTGSSYGRPAIGARLRRWRAKQVCATCPVAQQCLELAEETRADFGVYGGLDQKERSTLRAWEPSKSALAELAGRLRADGLTWRAIAERLGSTPEKLAQLRQAHSGGVTTRLALREYESWSDVASGMSAYAVSMKRQLPLERAEEMCQAMDKDPEYQGPKGGARYDGRNESVPC